MITPKFSILVANYNNGRYFREFYDSIIAQTCENCECIIVDDKSTDNSVQTIKEIIKEDERFIFIENDKNRGCGYTKRKCAELATGELCGFVDPDDSILPKALEKMVNYHLYNPNTGLVFSNKFRIYKKENKAIEDKKTAIQNNDLYFINLHGEISHFATFKRNIYQKTEGINPILQRAVDLDLYLKIYEVAEVKHLDEFLYNYNIYETGISSYDNVEKALYWRWFVTAEASKRRNVFFEEQFAQVMTSMSKLKQLENENKKLKSYNSFLEQDNLLKKIKRKLF